MRVKDFLVEYHDLIASNQGEGPFSAMQTICPGLSSPKLGKLLNRAVHFLDKEKEVYCEIGTHVGYTLISAAHNNNAACYGIDCFKIYGDNTKKEESDFCRDRLNINLSHFKRANQFFIESDYKNVDFKEKIGVFFVDGKHTREEVYENMKWVHGRLSDDALIFFDDISIGGVGDGILDWIKDHDEYKEIFKMNIFYETDKFDSSNWNSVFYNGLSIVQYKKRNKGE